MGQPAELLRDFVNTYDVGQDAEQLRTPVDLSGWLADRGLAPAGAAATAADLETAVRFREGLRAAMLAHHEREPQPLPPELEEVLARLPVRVSVAGGRPELVPLDGGIESGLSRLAAAVMASEAEGTWPRLKVCQESTCRAAFVDTSKNRSRAWCSMQVCGNRRKTRTYRARHRTAAR